MNRSIKRCLTTPSCFLLFVCFFLTASSYAQGLKVAAAASLQSIIPVLQKDFKQKTGIEIGPVIGSADKLAEQIKSGAPFDVFLSADMSSPETLFKEGLCTKAPTVYAYSRLIICSNQDIGFENWERVLLTRRVKKIALAGPSTPCGMAAQQLLQKKDLLSNVKNKIIYGEDLAQVNTYIATGVAEVGFTTQALIKDPANKKRIYWKLIDPKTYSPIKQGMVILKRVDNNPQAEKFYQYLLSADAKQIFEKYGYRVR